MLPKLTNFYSTNFLYLFGKKVSQINLKKKFLNQNKNLKILVLFLSLENNTECACLKPTLNR